MALSSQPFAGISIADARREEAEAEGQHDDIQHEVLLVAPVHALPSGVSWDWQVALVQHQIAGVSVPYTRISGREVPLAAYVFETVERTIL